MFLAVLFTILVTYVVAELIGYLFHRAAHIPGTKLYKSHMMHHLDAYPPSRFASEKYISIGGNSFVYWFIPLFLLFLGAQFLILSPIMFGVSAATTGLVAFVNFYVHDTYHLSGNPFAGTKFFKRLTDYHHVHHRNMKKNFGIYSFFIDRLFGTFRSPLELHASDSSKAKSK